MLEHKTVKKWIWVWDFEKEERWLNEMAMSGWALCGVGFCRYEFERCEPGEYTIRLEMHEDDADYLGLMEDIGAEKIGRMIQWIYFRRKTELGAFDLFSDIDSRIAHLNRIGRMLFAIACLNLGIGLLNSVNATHMGWINLICSCLLTYALGRIHGRREDLEQKRLLRE